MPAPDLAQLRILRAELATGLVQRAGDRDAPVPELRELQDRLRLVDAAIAEATPAQRRRLSVALAPALAIAALVSLAAALPVRRVPFTLELQAHTVRMQFETAGELASQAIGGGLRVEGFNRLESPAPELARLAADSSADRIALAAPQMNLRRIVHPAGSALVVEAGPQIHLSLQAPSPPVLVEIEFAGTTRWHLGDAQSRRSTDYAHAEWVRLTGGDPAAPGQRPPPLDLWLERPDSRTYAWNGLRPVGIQFVERRATGDADMVLASSLEQARITLPATGTEARLGAGDRLEIDGLALERFELVAGDTVVVKLSGSASLLATRTGDFERSLKPSLLEFVARHHTIGLFWSAAAVLWGVLGWLRKQLGADAS